jgi:hypothetical protein
MLLHNVNSRRQPRPASLSRHRDENLVTATPLESVLKNCDAHNSSRIRFYENTGVYTNNSHSGTENPSPALRSRLFPRPHPLSPFISYSSALFCTRQKLNSFVFMQFRTLCGKHPGGGYPPWLIEDQDDSRRLQDELDRGLVTSSSSTSHQSRVTSHLPMGCRPLAQMLRFGVP